MTLLVVTNGFDHTVPGLAVNKLLPVLSAKRITVAVRKVLRHAYGTSAVEVACHAELEDGTWRGRCRINGEQFTFELNERD